MSVLLGMSVLCVSSCSVSSRMVTRESRDRVATYDARDSFTAERVVVMDTVKEVTTITVDRNEAGDTIRMATVTDRLRARWRDAIAKQKTKTEVRVDTVYIKHRDSVYVEIPHQVRNEGGVRASPVVSSLKWIFWIIVAIGGLIIVAWVALRLKI